MAPLKSLCGNGQSIDHHKFWSNVAYLTATVVFAKIGWYAMPSDSLSVLFFVYLGCVGGSQLANTIIAGKFGANVTTDKSPEPKGEGK